MLQKINYFLYSIAIIFGCFLFVCWYCEKYKFTLSIETPEINYKFNMIAGTQSLSFRWEDYEED